MNEELLQEIKSTLPWLLGAAIVVGGFYGWKNYAAAQREAASASLVNAYTVEELEEAVAKFGSSDAQGALRLRLAKKYYDSERFQDAMGVYETLEKNPPDGFAEVPAVGKAQCLEALGKYAEAQAAFDAFAEANPKHYLTLTAKLGAARALAQAGDKAKALERLAALKASVGEGLEKARIEATEDVVKRYAK